MSGLNRIVQIPTKAPGDDVKVCVIGGGLMGMTLAWRLSALGHPTTVLEAAEQAGGLSTWHKFEEFFWDRFYHVILPTDRHLIRLVEELGRSEALQWRRTYTGFYVDNRMHSISSNMEFLRFPLLSLLSKVRLAFTMLYCSRIDDWERLEKVSVEDWLVKVSGKNTYERLWKPLLLAKLGENYRRVSAVFIWSYIKRLFSARDKSASAEHLGHVSGGYRMIFERLGEKIAAAGGTIETGVTVNSIRRAESNKIAIQTEHGIRTFDRVVCTSPTSVLKRIADPDLVGDIRTDNGQVEYLGVICVVVVSTKPLVPFYVVNIADGAIPFTGMIGMSTVVNTDNTGGRNLTYLPKYVLSTSAEFDRNDESIKKEFLNGVRRMLPDFDFDCITSVHVNRARKVQPLQVLNYSSLVPAVSTRSDAFYVLNTSQFLNATLNNNEVVGAVNRFVEDTAATFATASR